MINLVRNEMYKLFHKKSTLLIFLISGLLVFFAYIATNFLEDTFPETYGSEFGFSTNSQNMMYESAKYTVDNTDLNSKDRDVLYDYSWSLSIVETYDLIDKYSKDDPDSLIFYHIVEDIYPVIRDMYQDKYIGVESDYELQKEKYDSLINNLEHYDWKESILEKKKDIEEEIKNCEEMKTSDNAKEIDEQIKELKVDLEGINYRLEHNIALSFSNKSQNLDSYVSRAKGYFGAEKIYEQTPDSDNNKYDMLLQMRSFEEDYKIIQYAIENDVDLYNDKLTSDKVLADDISNFFETSGFADVFLTFFILMIVSGILAEEFNKGTIKQLLLRPAKRSKILTSKIIASVLASILFLAFLLCVNICVDIIKDGGIEGFKTTALVYDFSKEKVVEMNVLKYSLNVLVATLPKYVFYFGMALFLSVITCNVAISLVASYLTPLVMTIVGYLLSPKVSVYFPTSAYNLTQFMYGKLSDNQYLSLNLALIIDAFWIILFFVTTYVIFKRKDIKNQ